MNGKNVSYALDEEGNPLIIVRDQDEKQKVSGIEAVKVCHLCLLLTKSQHSSHSIHC